MVGKLTPNFPNTTTVRVSVVEVGTRQPVVPTVTAQRPAGASEMSVVVPQVPAGDYRVLVECTDAQARSAGYRAPRATVLPSQVSVVTIRGTSSIARIDVTPDHALVRVGGTEAFTATATLTDGTAVDVTHDATWRSSDAAVATVDDAGGATGVSSGATDIIAAVGDTAGVAHLSVGVTGLAVTPPTATVQVGETVRFTATATFADGSTKDVTDDVDWSTGSATKAAVDKGAVIGVTDGTTSVTASLEGQTASAQVDVVSTSTLVGITVTPSTVSLVAGTSQPLTAKATWSDGSTTDVTGSATWTSANANVVDVDGAGVVFGVTAGGPITVTAAFAGKTADTQVTVTGAVTVTGITVTPTNPSIAVGASQPFTATATYSDASTRDVTAFATWASADETVAAINDAGTVLGVKAGGPVNITAAFGGQVGGTTITVTSPVTMLSQAITPTTSSLFVNDTQGFIAIATFSDASTVDVTRQVTWTSSAPAVAPIDSSGIAVGLVPGATTITATFNSLTATAALTVVKPAVVGFTVEPATAVRGVGDVLDYIATAQLSDGTFEDVTIEASWVSSNPLVAAIDLLGSALGLAPGTTTITATMGAQSAAASLTITDTSPTPPAPGTVDLLVADTGNNRVVQLKSDATGWKSVGELGQQGANFRFNQPRSAVYGQTSKNPVVYVADQRNNQIVRFTAFKPGQWTTMGATGSGFNQYNRPTSVDQFPARCASGGNVLVADYGNRRLVQLNDTHALGQNQHVSDWRTYATGAAGPLVARVHPTGTSITYADSSNRLVRIDGIGGGHITTFGSTGSGLFQFSQPVDLKFDVRGRMYVADSGNNRIVRFDDMSGSNWVAFGTLGSGTNQLRQPSGLEVLADGRIVIHDTGNNRIVSISDMSGAGWTPFGTPGAGVNQFNLPDAFVGN